MSGHNKWSKIKHKKAATDAKKSKEFSRLVREIKVAVKDADGNAGSPGVVAAVNKAKTLNMPKDNIDRAIKSAQGGEDEQLESVLYETYGPGGVAILIETITDNKNRTGPEIKKILSGHEAALASPGSAAWAFENIGGDWRPKQTTPLPGNDKEKCTALIEALEEHDDVQGVVSNMK